jgi:chromosomal replication initiation ATPase DnaA
MTSESKEIAELIERVAAATGLGARDLMSGCRDTRHTRARFAAWLILRRQGMTYQRIGRAFGRDHRTIMHGVERGRALVESCEEFAAVIRKATTSPEAGPDERSTRKPTLVTAPQSAGTQAAGNCPTLIFFL